jgi:ABC-type sugar transport system substrate-binding protein
MNSGCDAIIYQNNFPQVTDSIIKEAVDAGVCVISYDAENKDATFSWISNNKMVGLAIGRMAGQWLVENCGGKGNLVVICNDSIPFLKARGDAIVEGVMEVAPNSEVIARQPARAITDGYTLADTLMSSNPKINCYVGTGDAAAVGVSGAYETVGWTEKLGTFGADCTPEAVAAMKKEGTFVAGSIDFRLADQMVNMIKTAYDYCENGTMTERVVIMGSTAVTRNNVFEYFPDI